MKLIRTVDAAGQVLCHDITQIIPGEYKDARFRKGHVIQPEDIPVLLSIGKENLYVWEKHPGILHEDEAAALLYKAAAGKNIHGTAPKEGKIELKQRFNCKKECTESMKKSCLVAVIAVLAAVAGALAAVALYLNRREKELDEYERLLFGEDDAETVEPEEAAAEDETEAE